MSPNDKAGRIPRQALVASSITLFSLCMLSVIARFYIRIRVQKQFSVDDGFVLAGTACLIGAFTVFMLALDTEYMIEAFVFQVPDVQLTYNFLDETLKVQQTTAAVVTLSWVVVACVKFSFLFLFRKLISRVRSLIVYWWIVVAVNVAVFGYGCSVYFVACPNLWSFAAVECASGSEEWRTVRYAILHMALDVFTDLLILYIPIRLIWKVQIETKQKLMLAMSLCLSIVMIVATVIRGSGIQYQGKVDHIWETYWIFVAGEVGLILTAITAFRSFFVARQNARDDPARTPSWYRRSKERLLRYKASMGGRSSGKSSEKRGGKALEGSGDTGETVWTGGSDETKVEDFHRLPIQFPKPTMTGIRTFINGRKTTKSMTGTQIMGSYVDPREDDDDNAAWKAAEEGRREPGRIFVRHDLSMQSESVRSTRCYQCGKRRDEHPQPLLQ